MKWYILESGITTVEVSGNSKNIKSIYKFVINHFFYSDRNVYLIKDGRIIGIIDYESSIKNKFDFEKMIIKDYYTVNESSSDEEILSTFLSSNYIYLPLLDGNGHILYELKLIKQNDDLLITKKRWEDLYKHNDKVVKALHEYSFKNIYVIGSLKSKLYNYIIINTKFNCFKISPNRNDFIEFLKKKAHTSNINAKFIQFNKISEGYKICDVVLIPSKSESFGYSALESLYLGIPTLLSKIPSLQEISEGSSTGILFGNTNIELALSLKQIAINKTIKRKEVSEQWIKKYSLDLFAQRYVGIINENR